MSTLEDFTLPNLKKLVNSSSLSKAYGYLDRIQNAIRTDQTLTAEVIDDRRYEVEIEATPGGLTAYCSCSYNWGGYCKHITAVLLKWIESPHSFAVKEAASVDGPAAALPVFSIKPSPPLKPNVRPFWVVELTIDRKRYDMAELQQALERLKVQDLRDLAKKRGWTIKGTGKADLARQISDYITRPDEIEKGLRGLDKEHRQVFLALVLLGHEAGLQTTEIERVATVWGHLKSYKQITTFTHHLSEAALALPAQTMGLYGLDADVVPRAIARQLPPVLDKVISSHPTRLPDPQADELHLADPLALVRLANQITMLLEQSSPPLRMPKPRPRLEKFYPTLTEWDYDPVELLELSKHNNLQPHTPNIFLTIPPPAWSLPDETVTRLAPIAGDESRLEFIFALLVAAGLFQPGSPVTIWPEIKEQYLRQTEAAQHAILARVYFVMLNWNELWDLLRANADLRLRRTWNYLYVKPANLSANLTHFRQLILRALACLPDGEWVDLNDLRPLLRALLPKFDGSMLYYYGAKPSWFLMYQGRELKPDDEQDWQIAQWPFIRQIIAGPLHWLGLADLSLKNGVLVAVRFHGLADLYWDRVETSTSFRAVATTPAPAPPPAEAVKMENLSIIVDPAAISAQAHNLLDQIARLDQTAPGQFVYRLDAQAAHQSFEKGVALTDILHDWEQFLAIPLSQTIRSQLEAWWQAYGQTRIYENVTLIEFGDDYALTEMKAVTSLEQHLIAELSPRLALIPKTVVGSLIAELEKAGYTPKQTDDVL